MVGIPITWLLFTVVFLVLARRHFVLSGQEMPQFELNPEGEGRVGKIMGVPTSQKDVGSFVRHFNDYIAAYNEASKKQNLYSALGYFAAALTAMFSLVLSICDLAK